MLVGGVSVGMLVGLFFVGLGVGLRVGIPVWVVGRLVGELVDWWEIWAVAVISDVSVRRTFGNVESAFAVAVYEHVIGIGDMLNIPAKHLIKRCGALEHAVHSVDRTDVPCRDVLVESLVAVEHTLHIHDRAYFPVADVWIAGSHVWSIICHCDTSLSYVWREEPFHVAHAGRVPGRNVTVRFLRRLLVVAPGVHRFPDVVIIHDIT